MSNGNIIAIHLTVLTYSVVAFLHMRFSDAMFLYYPLRPVTYIGAVDMVTWLKTVPMDRVSNPGRAT
jgi:hypothetical protein